MNKIIEISDSNYIQIKSGAKVYYGGNQSWWSDRKKRFYEYGCGVIAMTDIELYLMDKHIISKEQYIKLVDNRFRHAYYFCVSRGVPFWKMVIGLFRSMSAKSVKIFSFWAPSIRRKKLKWHIESMLSSNRPIPASYFVFFKRHALALYRLNEDGKLDYSQSINSHYFTITALYTDDTNDKIYLKISSWGEVFFIDYDAWLKRISIFSNILYYKKIGD